MAGGSNFFVAFRVLPSERRRGLTAVYRFCREADDAVDDAADPTAARRGLDEVRRRLDAAFDPARGRPTELRQAVETFELPRAPFEDLLEGVSWDLEGRRYADVDQLRAYCYRVASTVGLLCVRIFGFDDGSADPYARELGIAMQWTNILRDISVDRARGRVYLPRAVLDRHGLDEADLRSDVGAEGRAAVAALVREEAEYAGRCYAEADSLKPRGRRSELLAAEIMASVYRALLRRIARQGAGILAGPVRVSAPRRAWIAARLLVADRLAALAGR